MGFFQIRKPRGFHHTYIYSDERSEWRQRLKQETGEEERMRTADASRMRRGIWTRKNTGRKPRFSIPFCLAALVVMAWILYYLIKGTCIL